MLEIERDFLTQKLMKIPANVIENDRSSMTFTKSVPRISNIRLAVSPLANCVRKTSTWKATEQGNTTEIERTVKPDDNMIFSVII